MEELVYQGSADEQNRTRALLKRAADPLVERVGQQGLESVILTGGFGRGEGAVLREESSPGVPFNDFDFLLVGARPSVSAHVLRDLRRMLPRLLGVDFVDIGYIRSSQFRKALPTVFLYELKNGNRILWGSPGVLERIPSFAVSDLPLSEATRLLLNRGMGLLSVLLLFQHGDRSRFLRRNAAVAWSKIVLAAGDSVLLHRKLYHWSYVERMKRIQEIAYLSVIEDRFAETYRSAALFKLTADFTVLPTQDAALLCREAGLIHERYFRWLEQKRTFTDLSDWTEYPAVVLRAGLKPLRRRFGESLAEARSAGVHISNLRRFVRLPLWGEERRLALLPLVLYGARELGSRARESRNVEEACAIEFGKRDVQAEDWKRLAAELAGESHP